MEKESLKKTITGLFASQLEAMPKGFKRTTLINDINSLENKLSIIPENKIPDVILSLARFKDELTSFWIETGYPANKTDRSNADIASTQIAYKYRSELKSHGLTGKKAESLLGTVIALTSGIITDERYKSFGNFDEKILPKDAFSSKIFYQAKFSLSSSCKNLWPYK